MKALAGLAVLYIGPPSALLEELKIYIPSEGAQLSSCVWDAASREVARVKPALIIADIRREPDAGDTQLKQLRSAGSALELPVLALIDKAPAATALAARGTYNKYIVLPAHPADIVAAIATLAARLPPATSHAPAAFSLAELLKERAQQNDLRGLLALLNATGPFRFSSILRFDEHDQLTSLWTFDRENRESDSFPVDATTPSSYCAHVRESAAPFAMPDAALEPRAATHPKRHSVLSYCGVPLYDSEQTMIGTLCSYDLAPRFFAESTVHRLEETAAILSTHAPVLTRERPSKI